MPTSELLIPKEARRTMLRLNISILDSLDGILASASLKISLKYVIFPSLNENALFATNKVAAAVKRN